MNVQRGDLIRQLVEKKNYTKKAATSLVDDFTSIVIENLEEGNTVSLRNFGCFDMLERKERSCLHPQTREPIVIPAHWVPRFYPGHQMRLAVKVWEDNKKRGIK